MDYKYKLALKRFARVAVFGAAATVVGVALGPDGVEALNGTALAVFVPAITALLASADKYLRERSGS